jgi:hypothetical protein
VSSPVLEVATEAVKAISAFLRWETLVGWTFHPWIYLRACQDQVASQDVFFN